MISVSGDFAERKLYGHSGYSFVACKGVFKLKNFSILVVDDEKNIRDMLAAMLEKLDCSVTTAISPQQAINYAKTSPPDILLTDLNLPGMNGIELIKEISKFSKRTVSIVLTGQGTVEMAVKAMKAGAFTFLSKPLKKSELLVTVEKALEVHALKEENTNLKRALGNGYKDLMLGSSDSIQEVFDLIEAVADTDSTVLILGESGTGKELVAKGLHYNSSRRDKPFVPINCGAIPENLLESELFGHVKGAFTGAVSSREGRFEIAKGGTIFLDEIGDMSPTLQVKILRVLQEREFEPVGGTRSKKADVRIVAATHKDLEKAVREETFREDLYYRLNVIPICMPPMRERRDDVPILVEHFIKKFNKEKGRKLKGLSPEAMDSLINYSWPGNVRELENLMERLVILKREGEVALEGLPEKFTSCSSASLAGNVEIPKEGLSLKETVDEFEDRLIIQALERTKWNKNMAASLLKLNRTTLVEKIKKKGITPPSQD